MVVDRTFGGSATDRERVLAAYRSRAEQVCAAIRRNGCWCSTSARVGSRYCRFLGVPVPAEPFPHLNSTEAFWQMLRGGPPH